jgi:hypothetical protein
MAMLTGSVPPESLTLTSDRDPSECTRRIDTWLLPASTTRR